MTAPEYARPLATAARSADQLSRDEIVQAAVAATREHGINDLTMRGLATQLGVTAAAMYYYVPSKAQLVNLVADAVLESVAFPPPEAGDWVTRLRIYVQSTRQAFCDHPGVAPLYVREHPSQVMLDHSEETLALLFDAGFPPRAALQAFNAVNTFTFGSAFTELRHVQAAGRNDIRDRLLHATVDPVKHPAMTALRKELETSDPIDYFAFGLDALLTGLQAKLTEYRKSSRRGRKPRR